MLYPHIQLDCKLEVPEDEIPDAIKVVIFRVAQETMTNSVKTWEGFFSKDILGESLRQD